jgi:dienelactone hydrolase
VSFHGVLDTPTPENAKNIKGHVLVLHGAADPVVNLQAVDAFEKEMTAGGVDWQVALCGPHVLHAFADNTHHGGPGAAYDANADKRSWQAMSDLLKGTL